MDHLPGLILAFTGLAIFVAVSWYVIGKIRQAGNKTKTPSAEELLARFGRMYDEGELSREEYRAIKMTFASTLSASRETPIEDKSDEDRARDARLQELLRSERR